MASSTWTDGKIITTAHDRYHVSDDTCGLIATSTGFLAALDRAASHRDNHPDCGGITIFDVMARRGNPNKWDASGKILGYRGNAA